MTTVTFLGVGAALPAPGQTNCAYLIEGGGARLLFDCGPAILQQLAAVGKTPGDVTHVFISHAHGDHALGWPMFLLWWALEGRDGRPFPVVIAGKSTWKHLRGLWEHSYSELPAPPYKVVELHDEFVSPHEMTPAAALNAYPMVHSTRSPVLGAALKLGSRYLAFTADTARCDHISLMARHADLLVHDARYAVTVPPDGSAQSKYHCSARDAGEYAEAAGVKNLALVHIGAEYEGRHDDLVAEARTRFAGHVFAPKAGDVFRL
ncbi:MAG: MBL fold metallo-hydrolase [Gemmataceae bacterium]